MSVWAQSWAYEQRLGKRRELKSGKKSWKGDPGAKSVLAAVATFADEAGYAYCGQGTLAEMTDMTECSVREHLHNLEHVYGKIRRKHRRKELGKGKGEYTSDGIWLLAPAHRLRPPRKGDAPPEHEPPENFAVGEKRAHGRKSLPPGGGTISYREKEKRYEGRFTVQTSRGPKRKVVYGKDFEETRRKLNAAIKDRDDGLVFDAEEMTLAEYLRRWLNGPAKRNVRPSTYARYEQLSRKHLIPALGSLRLKKLTALHLENLYEDKLEKGLSPRTVNYIHTTASKALGHAVAKDLLRRNVASFAEAPQPKGPEMLTLNRKEARDLLEAAKGNRLEALYVLALATGMRRSELLGLKWGDLDLEACILLIGRGLTVSPDGGVEIDDPKRFSSKRRLDISPKVAAVLKEHRRRQTEERLAAGQWRDEGFVFTSRSGGFLHPNTLYTAYFKKLRDRADVPPIHFHDLRHTYATLALLLPNAKVKIVSETLGHKDVATTLRIYAHVLPGMQREAAEAMDSILF